MMTTREFLRARVIRLYRVSLPLLIAISAISVWGRRSVLLSGLVLSVVAVCICVRRVYAEHP